MIEQTLYSGNYLKKSPWNSIIILMATKKDWFLVCWLNVVGPLLLVKPKISQQKMPLDRKLFRWHFFLDFCVKIWLPMWRGWEDISILIMCQRIHLSGDREKHSRVTECGCWWRSGRVNGMWDSRKSSERLKNLEEIGRICRYLGRIWVICVWSLDKFLDRKKISIYIGSERIGLSSETLADEMKNFEPSLKTSLERKEWVNPFRNQYHEFVLLAVNF